MDDLIEKATTGKRPENKVSLVRRCYLGLGSNLTNELGTPSQHIQRAFDSLSTHWAISHTRLSSMYHSVPMGPQDQPDFINAVVELDTKLSPFELLKLCQQLEQDAMRVRQRHWGERSLDVDILLYDNKQIDLPDLKIPHIGICERNFVLVPLTELNPELVINDRPVREQPLSQNWSGLVKLGSVGVSNY